MCGNHCRSANFIVQCVYFEILLLALPVYEKYAQLPALNWNTKQNPAKKQQQNNSDTLTSPITADWVCGSRAVELNEWSRVAAGIRK